MVRRRDGGRACQAKRIGCAKASGWSETGMLEVWKERIIIQSDRHRTIARRSPHCFFTVISVSYLLLGHEMQLPDDPRETLCLQVWWAVIRESTSSACFSPASFTAWSRSKQNTWSPPQMGSACRVQSGSLAATSCQIRAGDSPSPPALHITWELGFSHRPCLQPRPCSSSPSSCPEPKLQPPPS